MFAGRKAQRRSPVTGVMLMAAVCLFYLSSSAAAPEEGLLGQWRFTKDRV